MLTSVEVCAGAGGQALGLETAGFSHAALVEIEKDFCTTLQFNRPKWNVIQQDLNQFDGRPYAGADLFAGGLPCPPFSIAGKQLGANDERNLFPAALRVIDETRPRAVLIENVRGFLDAVFEDYRGDLKENLRKLGYVCDWKLLNASEYGVPQLRPRVAIVGIQKQLADLFDWPQSVTQRPPTVGETLWDLMGARGWRNVWAWRKKADDIAPTIVGGSKKHGGPDLGPTRARKAWMSLGVDGLGIADEAPDRDFSGNPRLTVRMVARLQGFPDSWSFSGKKTSSYRQVGNAFPPPVAEAVGVKLRDVLTRRRSVAVTAG
jgi:DNA (cytosine-5)-methyltransferase 1